MANTPKPLVFPEDWVNTTSQKSGETIVIVGVPMSKNIGARFEIAIDGTPRTYRDRRELAIEAAAFLKMKNVHAEVTVRDVESGEVIVVRHPLAK
jgi:hypothetical protein